MAKTSVSGKVLSTDPGLVGRVLFCGGGGVGWGCCTKWRTFALCDHWHRWSKWFLWERSGVLYLWDRNLSIFWTISVPIRVRYKHVGILDRINFIMNFDSRLSYLYQNLNSFLIHNYNRKISVYFLTY